MDGPYREALDGWPWQWQTPTNQTGGDSQFQPGKNPVDLRLELQVSEGGWEELKKNCQKILQIQRTVLLFPTLLFHRRSGTCAHPKFASCP